MKISKNDFIGTKSVFLFTFSQFFKNKSIIFSMVFLFAFVLLSNPLMGFFMGNSQISDLIEPDFEPHFSAVEKVYILDETGADPSAPFGGKGIFDDTEFIGFASFENTEFIKINAFEKSLEEAVSELSPFDALVKFSGAQNVTTDIIPAKETELTYSDLEELSYFANDYYYNAMQKLTAVSDEQLSLANSGYTVDSIKENELNSKSVSEISFLLQYAYSVMVLILCTYSSSHIIRAILEEKSSKLVELLMVSVKPLALIMGKIFAVMVFMFIQVVGAFVCLKLSGFISGFFFDTAAMANTLSGLNLEFIVNGIGIFKLILILISLALAYLTVSIISGISGACCNSINDAGSASSASMLLVLFGYMTSFICASVPSETLSIVTSLVPFLSIFCAPTQYLAGNIDLWVLLLSFVIQFALVVILFVFCSRVYSSLIIHSGNKVKFKELLAIAKANSKGVKTDE